MAAGSFKFKTLMILSFLLIWAVVAAAHVFYYAVVKREESLKETRRIAWREAEIPSLRGRILDKNGVPAAWSELRHNLVLEKIPESRRRRDNLFRASAQKRSFAGGNRLLLAQAQELSGTQNRSSHPPRGRRHAGNTVSDRQDGVERCRGSRGRLRAGAGI